MGTLSKQVRSGHIRADTWSSFQDKLQAGTGVEAGGTENLPFGFPSASTADSTTSDVVLTYPPDLTKHLLVLLTEQQCIDENIPYVPELRDATRKRKQACNEVQAQTW